MENVFTEVTLERTKKMADGLVVEELTDITKLFKSPQIEIEEPGWKSENNNAYNTGSPSYRSLLCSGCLPGFRRRRTIHNYTKPKGQKIFLIGKTGTGKTALGKKLAYDWANGVFTAFAIVFFISLKSVKPGDSLEAIIMDQIPDLNTLNLTETNL